MENQKTQISSPLHCSLFSPLHCSLRPAPNRTPRRTARAELSPARIGEQRRRICSFCVADLKNCSAAAAASTGDPPPRPDKLLGGLLRPDFEEASCVSRYQSSQFWHSNHTPSSYLLRKLRSYEALHKKCGPNTELFNRSLQHLNAGAGGGNSECNYVVWLQAGGLGNRLIALVSAFLYALLNDKVLLLSVPGDLHDTFCEPFPDTSWVLPSNFPISLRTAAPGSDGISHEQVDVCRPSILRLLSLQRAAARDFLSPP